MVAVLEDGEDSGSNRSESVFVSWRERVAAVIVSVVWSTDLLSYGEWRGT